MKLISSYVFVIARFVVQYCKLLSAGPRSMKLFVTQNIQVCVSSLRACRRTFFEVNVLMI